MIPSALASLLITQLPDESLIGAAILSFFLKLLVVFRTEELESTPWFNSLRKSWISSILSMSRSSRRALVDGFCVRGRFDFLFSLKRSRIGSLYLVLYCWSFQFLGE